MKKQFVNILDMRKKRIGIHLFIAVLLCVLLAVGLAACGQSSDDTGESGETSELSETDGSGETSESDESSESEESETLLTGSRENISSMNISCYDGMEIIVDTSYIELITSALEAADTTYVPYPTSADGQNSDPIYILTVVYSDGKIDTIYTTETGSTYYRYTDTYGDGGEQGYVMVTSEDALAFIEALIQETDSSSGEETVTTILTENTDQISSMSIEYIHSNTSFEKTIDQSDALLIAEALAELETTSMLYPTSADGQNSDPVYIITVEYSDGESDTIYTTETGSTYYRYTDTYGDGGEQGYIMVMSEDTLALIEDQFAEYDGLELDNVELIVSTGSYVGQADSNFIEIQINEDSEEDAYMVFLLSSYLKENFDELGLETGDEVTYEYYVNEDEQNAIISIIIN